MLFERRYLSTFDESFNEVVEYLSDIATGVALRFVNELDQQLKALSEMPYLYPIYQYDKRFRKMTMSDWKYAVFYIVNEEQNEIIFYSILHTSRDIPTYLKNTHKLDLS